MTTDISDDWDRAIVSFREVVQSPRFRANIDRVCLSFKAVGEELERIAAMIGWWDFVSPEETETGTGWVRIDSCASSTFEVSSATDECLNCGRELEARGAILICRRCRSRHTAAQLVKARMAPDLTYAQRRAHGHLNGKGH